MFMLLCRIREKCRKCFHSWYEWNHSLPIRDPKSSWWANIHCHNRRQWRRDWPWFHSCWGYHFCRKTSWRRHQLRLRRVACSGHSGGKLQLRRPFGLHRSCRLQMRLCRYHLCRSRKNIKGISYIRICSLGGETVSNNPSKGDTRITSFAS